MEALRFSSPALFWSKHCFLQNASVCHGRSLAELMALSDAPTSSICVVPLDLAVARAVSDFGPAAVPELADRIIAATARALNLPLLTTDPAIVASGLVKVAQ